MISSFQHHTTTSSTHSATSSQPSTRRTTWVHHPPTSDGTYHALTAAPSAYPSPILYTKPSINPSCPNQTTDHHLYPRNPALKTNAPHCHSQSTNANTTNPSAATYDTSPTSRVWISHLQHHASPDTLRHQLQNNYGFCKTSLTP